MFYTPLPVIAQEVSELMSEWIDLEDVPGLLRPGQRVYVGGSANEPATLVGAIVGHPDAARDVTFIQQPLAINRHDFSSLHPTSQQETFFATPTLKDGMAAGRVRFIPMQMRAIFSYLASTRIDVALLGAARDRDGRRRFGHNVDYVDAVVASASLVVVEVSDQFTAAAGAPRISETKTDFRFVATHSPPAEFPVAAPDDTSRQIGGHIADLIQDGDCLQTGIGAVPAAILAQLDDKNDLGFHGGLVDDGVVALARNGNLTGATKNFDRGLHLSGMALGSREMLDYLATDDSFVFRGADYTHEVSVIARLDRFVSINSAVEVDLFGQVNAERVAGQQISGTGGAVDFMRAAKASKGGRSVVAMTATARRGTQSRIVPRVDMVTALRTDVDLVVTEFGVADIRNASLNERAEKLTSVAHPDFREMLRDAWRNA